MTLRFSTNEGTDIEKFQDLQMINCQCDLEFFGVLLEILPELRNQIMSAGRNHLVSARSDEV